MFRLSFLSSSAAGYHDAVELAKACTIYREESAGPRARLHRCELVGTSESAIRHFLQVWHAVQRWAGSRLEVDGQPLTGAERFSAERILECMARASAFDPPQRYCHSYPVRAVHPGADPRDPPKALLPCRLWAQQWGVSDVEWHNSAKREDQIRASLMDRGLARCPFLSFEQLPSGRSLRDVNRATATPSNVVAFRPRGAVDSGA